MSVEIDRVGDLLWVYTNSLRHLGGMGGGNAAQLRGVSIVVGSAKWVTAPDWPPRGLGLPQGHERTALFLSQMNDRRVVTYRSSRHVAHEFGRMFLTASMTLATAGRASPPLAHAGS